MRLKFRRLEEKDIPKILALAKERKYQTAVKVSDKTAFWTKKELINWVNKSQYPLIIVENEGKIIGFIFFTVHHPTGKATLENILVSQKYREKGIGTKLIKISLKELKKQGVRYICALARADNEDMVNFLLNNSFKDGYEFIWFEKTWR